MNDGSTTAATPYNKKISLLSKVMSTDFDISVSATINATWNQEIFVYFVMPA